MHANFETVEEFLIADVVSCPKLVKNGRESKKYNHSKVGGKGVGKEFFSDPLYFLGDGEC